MKLFKRGFAMMLALVMLVMAVPFGGMAVYAAEDYPTIEPDVPTQTVYAVEDYPTIEPGVTTQAVIDEEYAYFWFTPVESGWYRFYSMADRDTYGYVYDVEGNTLKSNDDDGEGNNFSITYLFEAGVTYKLGARFYSRGTGSFPVCFEPCSPKTITGLNFYDRTLLMYQVEADHYMGPKVDVYFSDGSFATWESNWVSDDVGEYYIESDYDVQPEDWQEGGVYTVTYNVNVNGATYEGQYTITIEECPIQSIVFEPYQVVEYGDGYWSSGSYWDDALQETVPYEYFHYYSVTPRATITMKDGTVHKSVNGFYWNDSWRSVSVPQSYRNPLVRGVNQVSGSILGYDYTLEIEVIESPIASIELAPILLMEHSSGYWNSGSHWDDELQQNVPHSYYYYYVNPRATIIMKDGTVYENVGGLDWYGRWYSLSDFTQDWYNCLQLGTNYVTTTYLGYEYTMAIEVVTSPVQSVTINQPISLVENQKGYWDYTEYWDEELQQDVSIEFFYYYYNYTIPNVTITLTDGSVYTLNSNNTSIYWNGSWHEIDVQSQWNGDYLRPGRNIRTATILGCTFEYEINVNSMNSNDSFEYLEAEDYVIITDCFATDETVEVPAEINGKPVIGVTSLHSAWYSLRHLVLPDSVLTIGDYMLSQLDNLQSVHFGAGVSNLTAEMFGYCWGLQSITISEDNPYYCVANNGLHNKALDTFIAYPTANENQDYMVPATVVNIDALDWYGIYDRVNVIFPEDHVAFVTVDGVTYNKEMTVVISCDKDKTGDYVMPNTVEEIASSAFMGSNLTSVVVSPLVTEIVYCAFASCANLESVTLPMGVISIEQSAFENTFSLQNIDLPETLEYIGTYAFHQSGLPTLSVPDSVVVIDDSAFASSRLETLDLGNGLQSIGGCAFAYTNVDSVVLPDSLTLLDWGAFSNCYALSSVTIGSGLTCIGGNAFYNAWSLMDITIPGTVEMIDGSAFGNAGLHSVTLEDGVGYISSGAFGNCDYLTAVHFPASVYYIDSTALNSCDSLTTLTVDAANEYYFSNGNCIITYDGILQVGCGSTAIPNDGSVQCIEGYAFYNCDSLWAITLPDSLEIIGESAFAGCDNLQTVTFPYGLQRIDSGAFENCNSITSVILPDTVTTIGSGAFASCDNLTNVELGDGLERLGGGIFAGCPLESVDMGHGLTDISDYMFANTALPTVFIPDSVTTIMYRAFTDCYNLTSIELPISVTTIDYSVFANCYNLTDVYYQGTEADRENIYIEWGNEYLENATWHYGWVNENWAELPTCDHVYDGVCDSDCNECGAYRRAPHAYENACAEWCLYCKEWREPAAHIYDNACDDTCNECGALRAVMGHWYDNACDVDCSECGAIREVGDHVYDNACDINCNECGATRVAADHIYSDKYDADCNECGAIREALSPITLVVDSLTACLGDTFNVAVRIENNTGLVGFRFNVVYDEAQFELIGATAGPNFSAASFGPVQSPFSVLWIDAIHPDNMSNGTIVTLTFRVKEGATLGGSVIEVIPSEDDFIDSNFESVLCEAVSGTITVVDRIAGDADGDGKVSVVDLGYLQRLITGWNMEVEVDADALDVNKDGKLNNRDVALLQRYLNGWDITLQ